MVFYYFSQMSTKEIAGIMGCMEGTVKSRLYTARTNLKRELTSQQDAGKEVEAYEAYVKTDDYVKEIAEEKLGLVDPNEIIFKPAK